MPVIRAVTFDFWSTLYVPQDRGQFQMVRDACPAVLQAVLAEAGFSVNLAAVRAAYVPPAVFGGPAVTLSDTISAMCRQLGIQPTVEVQRRLVRALDELAGQIRWTHAPGAPAVLRHLRQRDYQLGLVANAHFPSSRVIRQILGADGTLMYFQAFAFSDEVGVYKPDAAIFRHVLYHLDLETRPETVVHVGDHPEQDVAGARAVGMRTVRYAGYRDRPASPEADAVLSDFRDLPSLIRHWQQ